MSEETKDPTPSEPTRDTDENAEVDSKGSPDDVQAYSVEPARIMSDPPTHGGGSGGGILLESDPPTSGGGSGGGNS
jgi:hypothetical protein